MVKRDLQDEMLVNRNPLTILTKILCVTGPVYVCPADTARLMLEAGQFRRSNR
jgi:hypothetical protein